MFLITAPQPVTLTSSCPTSAHFQFSCLCFVRSNIHTYYSSPVPTPLSISNASLTFFHSPFLCNLPSRSLYTYRFSSLTILSYYLNPLVLFIVITYLCPLDFTSNFIQVLPLPFSPSRLDSFSRFLIYFHLSSRLPYRQHVSFSNKEW